MVIKSQKMVIKTSAQVVVLIVVTLACAYTAGLAFSSLMDYFDSLPKPLITHDESKWGYYATYCTKPFAIVMKQDGLITNSFTWYEYCNI